MILCHCSVVTDRDVRACVEQGAASVTEVLRRTGAGAVCGGCGPAVRACAKVALCQAGRDANDLEVWDATG